MTTPSKLFLFIAILTGMACETEEGTKSTKIEPTVLNIEINEAIPIHHKITMAMTESRASVTQSYKGKIERRGGHSITYPKHSYEIDLKEDAPLASLPPDDDWILNANYIDKTFLRHTLSYELFSAMDSNNIAPKCRYVEVNLNGEYNGLYVLMEKLDKSSLEIKGSDSLAFIFKEPQIFRKTYDGIAPQDSSNFHQQTYPKINKVDKRIQVEAIREFILKSSDSEFQETFANRFDINNIIDWHLLLLISNNNDGILKNYYLYKPSNKSPIRVAPWDYDHSFGRDGDNELNLDTRPLDIKRSILFQRLIQSEWYRTALSKRWQDLNNKSILSKSGLKRRILVKSEGIREIAKKNYQKWPVDNELYYDSNNFDEELDIMLKFIELRHLRLVKYFEFQ